MNTTLISLIALGTVVLLIISNAFSYYMGQKRGHWLSNIEWKTYLLDVSNRLMLNDTLYTFSRELFHKTSIYDLHKKYIVENKDKKSREK